MVIRNSFMPRRLAAALALTLIELGGTQVRAQANEAATAQAKFDVWEYRVLGNTVLKRTEIETLMYSQLGPAKTLDDVEKARVALETAYRDRGYGTVFVDIPEQEVAEGIVRLQVTEGKINSLRVTGTRYFSNRAIRAALPAAQPGIVPHLPTVQRQLSALNAQTPDRNVVPVLKAGPRPGTVDLGLTVKDEVPVHASVEVNNQYTTDTTELRAVSSVSYDNAFGRLDSLALQYQTSPEDMNEVSVWAGSYTARLPNLRSKLALFYINSDSDIATVGDAGADVNVFGKGQIFGARYIDPFYVAADATHVFIASAEYKDFNEKVITRRVDVTPITYVNWSIGHSSAWRFERQQVSLASSMSFGMRGVANEAPEFRDKRAHGRPNYWNLRADTSYGVQLPWKLQFTARGSGQYAVDPIISNEQFSIAGADGVRGYREAEQMGDIGFKTSAELAYTPIDMFAQRVRSTAFVFFDFGRMSRLEPLRDPVTGRASEVIDHTLRSTGIGFEFSAFDFLTGSLTWAYPLANTPTWRSGGTQDGDSRIHFSIRSHW